MSPFTIYKKNEHLVRAKDLLKTDCGHLHRYACLELRFCIEAITYQILLSGIKNIPNSIIETWQPNIAMKMLAEFSMLAVSDCELSFALSSSTTPPLEGWLKLGEQKVPDLKWLGKAYNKLGNYLHLTPPKKAIAQAPVSFADKIAPIAEKLEKYIHGNLIVSINIAKIAQCPCCKSDFIFDVRKVKNGDIRLCTAPKCGVSMIATLKNQNEIVFEYNTYDIDCRSCSHKMIIPEGKIRNLDKIEYEKCQAMHLIKGTYSIALVS